MRAALYHRVSTLDQNPALAREELRAAATRLGTEVVLDVEEAGSGTRNDRPGFQQLMNAARGGKLDAVLVWKLDRFGRSALDVLTNIRELESAGVRFVATSQGIDVRPSGDAVGRRLLLTMLAAVAEFERDLIRERTRLGLARARANNVARPRPLVERRRPSAWVQPIVGTPCGRRTLPWPPLDSAADHETSVSRPQQPLVKPTPRWSEPSTRADSVNEPVHDWSSHAADAFRYVAVMNRPTRLVEDVKQEETSRSETARCRWHLSAHTLDQMFAEREAKLARRGPERAYRKVRCVSCG